MSKKILIIHTFGLGDMVMFTPTLKFLKDKYDDSEIDFLIFQRAASTPIEICSQVNRIYYSDFSILNMCKIISFIRKKKYDISIVSSGTNPWKASLFAFLCGAKERIGEYYNIKIPFNTTNIKYTEHIHRVDNNLALVGADDNHIGKTFFCIPEGVTARNDNKTKLLIIHAGSNVKFRNKRWRKENFVELIILLLKHYDYRLLLIAGPDEIEDTEYISKSTGVEMISGRSLQEVATLISSCDLFINTDSGLGHIASCFNIRMFTIFGPAKEYKTRPYSENSFAIKLNLDCQPCYGKNIKCTHFNCLNMLKPEYVFETIKNELEKI